MKTNPRKIAVLTGTRAEYGHLYWILKEIQDDPHLHLQLLVTGMHLSPEFGLTIREIEADGFPIAEKIEMLLSSDSEVGVSNSLALEIIGLANAFAKLKPDILVLLGDRFEVLAAAVAAVLARIPIAHIHGGESSEGAIDEAIRHAVTKMSHVHFPATAWYARRIRQMGEDPSRIFPFGAPGLENLYRLNLPEKDALLKDLGVDCPGKLGIVTYHPVTLEFSTARQHIAAILEAIQERNITWVFTLANADPGGRAINQMIQDFCRNRPAAYAFPNLGQRRYLGLLRIADVMLGNSSSGLIEAPSFRLPVVNVGDRQRGRVRAVNVIDCGAEPREIAEALDRALHPKFRDSLQDLKNPYGNGQTVRKIVSVLKEIPLDGQLLKKRFLDIPACEGENVPCAWPG